ncbi:MAG: hypothetical protein RXQ70_01460 [Sulfolobaceae archaeon]|nr:hypothetical protein [Sulfolobales archaeon]
MLWKLIKFAVISRISKRGLILLILLNAFILLIGFGAYFHGVTSLQYESYATLYVAFIFVLLGLQARIGILKSDFDYYFTLPIERKTLGTALIIANLIFMSALSLSFVTITLSPYGFAVAPFLGISLASLTLMTYGMSLKERVAIFGIIGLWLSSASLGFPFSPLSAVTGHPIEGLLSAAAFAVVTLYFGVRRAGALDVVTMREISRSETGREASDTVSFTGTSPFLAVLRLKLHYVGITSRYGFMGATASVRARAIPLRTAMPIVAIVGVIYFIVLSVLRASGIESVTAAMIMGTVYMFTFVMTTAGSSSVTLERFWPTVVSLGPKYLKYVILSSVIQAMVLISPVGIAQLTFLLLFETSYFTSSALVLFGYIPLATAISIMIFAYFIPVQLKDDLNVTYQEFRPIGFVAGMLTGLLFMPAALFTLIPAWVMVVAIALIALILAALTSEDVLKILIEKMTERGYI